MHETIYHVNATAVSLAAVGFLVEAGSLTAAVPPVLWSNSCSFLIAFLFMITVLFSAAS